jgi:hypothetical protein
MKPPRSLALAAPQGGSCSGPAEPDPRKALICLLHSSRVPLGAMEN